MAIKCARGFLLRTSAWCWRTVFTVLPVLCSFSGWCKPLLAEAAIQSKQNASLLPADNPAGQAIDFRCDTLYVLNKPNRHTCERNVILRRGDIILCCQHFEGIADANWAWQKFICRGDVRVWRSAETVWAQQAAFDMASGDVTLTGDPLLARMGSVIAADRITFAVQQSRAHVWRPRGRIERFELPSGPGEGAPRLFGALPATCPIAPRPDRAS